LTTEKLTKFRVRGREGQKTENRKDAGGGRAGRGQEGEYEKQGRDKNRLTEWDWEKRRRQATSLLYGDV